MSGLIFQKPIINLKLLPQVCTALRATILTAIGLASEPVQNLQLWRNGKQVPVYTSVASGAIGSGYLEFYGQKNDGTLDRELYKTPALQLSDEVSLQTDSSAYFLTVDRSGNKLRFNNAANDVAGNTLPAEPYFIYQLQK